MLQVEPEPGETGTRFQLPIGAVELVRGLAGLTSLTFACNGTPPVATRVNGILTRFVTARERPDEVTGTKALAAIDHVVIHSVALERAKAAWEEGLGLRLALDKTFEARGLRILFFRSAGITLEIAGPLVAGTDEADDQLYGITYRVTDLAAHRERLLAAGVAVSAIRTGFKPQTLVATVRSGTGGVPTLLLEDPSRSAQ